MSVFKRKSKYGETREYHYKFMAGREMVLRRLRRMYHGTFRPGL